MEPTSKKLFISYSRKDKVMARRVADALEIQGYDVFWDAEIPPGQKFDSYIFSQLEQSDAVVVLWSTHSIASDYVKEEADYAKTNSVLVPLRIDNTGLPFGFARIQTTDLFEWQGSIQDPEWRLVVEAIESSIQGRRTSPPPELETEEVGDELEASRRSIPFEPVQPVKPKRTHVSASAILAIAIVMFMLLGIFVFAMRLV
jgi:hypothetical protein